MEFDNNNFDGLDFDAFMKRAKQTHHDYYLRALYEGKLDEIDLSNLSLAIDRERSFEVSPLGVEVPNLEEEIQRNN